MNIQTLQSDLNFATNILIILVLLTYNYNIFITNKLVKKIKSNHVPFIINVYSHQIKLKRYMLIAMIITGVLEIILYMIFYIDIHNSNKTIKKEVNTKFLIISNQDKYYKNYDQNTNNNALELYNAKDLIIIIMCCFTYYFSLIIISDEALIGLNKETYTYYTNIIKPSTKQKLLLINTGIENINNKFSKPFYLNKIYTHNKSNIKLVYHLRFYIINTLIIFFELVKFVFNKYKYRLYLSIEIIFLVLILKFVFSFNLVFKIKQNLSDFSIIEYETELNNFSKLKRKMHRNTSFIFNLKKPNIIKGGGFKTLDIVNASNSDNTNNYQIINNKINSFIIDDNYIDYSKYDKSIKKSNELNKYSKSCFSFNNINNYDYYYLLKKDFKYYFRIKKRFNSISYYYFSFNKKIRKETNNDNNTYNIINDFNLDIKKYQNFTRKSNTIENNLYSKNSVNKINNKNTILKSNLPHKNNTKSNDNEIFNNKVEAIILNKNIFIDITAFKNSTPYNNLNIREYNSILNKFVNLSNHNFQITNNDTDIVDKNYGYIEMIIITIEIRNYINKQNILTNYNIKRKIKDLYLLEKSIILMLIKYDLLKYKERSIIFKNLDICNIILDNSFKNNIDKKEDLSNYKIRLDNILSIINNYSRSNLFVGNNIIDNKFNIHSLNPFNNSNNLNKRAVNHNILNNLTNNRLEKKLLNVNEQYLNKNRNLSCINSLQKFNNTVNNKNNCCFFERLLKEKDSLLDKYNLILNNLKFNFNSKKLYNIFCDLEPFCLNNIKEHLFTKYNITEMPDYKLLCKSDLLDISNYLFVCQKFLNNILNNFYNIIDKTNIDLSKEIVAFFNFN